MARFYADEQFPLPVVELLRNLGHDVLTVQEAGNANQRIPDEQVLAFAVSQERAILTINRIDFIRLHRRDDQHFGIVVCTIDILTAVKRTAIPHHATFLEWSLNGVDASRDAASLTEVLRFPPRPFKVSECPPATLIFTAAFTSRS
jgi:predicted nuclease of predicted toxin-antitoxin system